MPVLLHGVTGSGKTEIYTHLIAEALSSGQQVLFLVPEIALTTQLIERLRRFFGDVVHVYHSRFSDRERTETWMTVLNPKAGQLIVGARSAVLLPLPKLGLVVVDEEHEPSFKQHDPAPRYHARDVALWMSARQHAPLVLGSATPSVETQWLGEQGQVEVVTLTERFGGVMLPEIFLADLRKEHKQRSMRGGFSKMLRDEMEATLKEGKQIILFQTAVGTHRPTSAHSVVMLRNVNVATSRLWSTRPWAVCIAITAVTTNGLPPMPVSHVEARRSSRKGWARSALKKSWRNCFPKRAWHAWIWTPHARKRRMRSCLKHLPTSNTTSLSARKWSRKGWTSRTWAWWV